MATSPVEEFVDITGAALNKQIQKQKWYQEHANAVTTAVGFLATVASFAATQPIGASPTVQIAILIVGFLATVFGVSQTKNGISKSQVAKINKERSKVIGQTPLIVSDTDQRE